MNIQLNGDTRTLDDKTTLHKLIELEGLTGKRLAAEVNHEIIAKAEHPDFILHEGDIIEIVHAIGGG